MKRVLQKKSMVTGCCLLLLISAFTGKIFSQTPGNSGIPHVIVFQSVITEKDGRAIPDGTYDVSFSIYDVKEGGNPVWTEIHPGFKIEKGNLNVLLGKKNPSNPIAFKFDRKLYLDIKINNDVNIHQRIELGSTAYSLASEYAEEVDDLSITTDKFADGAVTDEKIESVSFSALRDDISPDPYSVYWTILGNIILGPERNYIGTIEAKDFVIKTFSIERMRFGPTGRVTMGTPEHTVIFTVIGKTKFQDTFIKGDLGVGVMPGAAKVHINSPGQVPFSNGVIDDIPPFRVDVDDVTRFKVNQNGKVVISTAVGDGDEDERDKYPLFLNSEEQGIGIKVKGSSDNDNNFVSFWNNKGMQGRIEGENYEDYISDPAYLMRDAYIIATGVADVLAFGLASSIEPASAIAFTAEVLYNEVVIVLENTNLGVTYESSSGDYAEWLEKTDEDEVFQAGEIVGIVNGKITKNTIDADQLSCISFAPIVLGNKPPADKTSLYEKVAFLGQVPVKVIGKVNRGDYIIPSGLNDGTGIAVAPEMMTIDEYLIVLGRTWGESDNEDIKYVNTAIGFDNDEIIKIIQLENQKQVKLNSAVELTEKKIQQARQKLSDMNIEIEKVSNHLNKPDTKTIKTSSEL